MVGIIYNNVPVTPLSVTFICISIYLLVFSGITQEEIDETRLIPEKQMLNDLQKIANRRGDLEFPTPEGATPVSPVTVVLNLV